MGVQIYSQPQQEETQQVIQGFIELKEGEEPEDAEDSDEAAETEFAALKSWQIMGKGDRKTVERLQQKEPIEKGGREFFCCAFIPGECGVLCEQCPREPHCICKSVHCAAEHVCDCLCSRAELESL